MTKLIIDASFWIEYLLGTKKGEKLKLYLESESEIITLPITLAEVISRVVRVNIDSDIVADNIRSLSIIINDSDFAQHAGELHAKIKLDKPKFSLADAFLLSAAKGLKGNILTCDNDFRGMKEAEVV